MKSTRNLVTLEELSNLKTDIFPINRLKHLVRERELNGFDRCLYKISNRIYVDLEKLNDWIQSKNLKG